MIAQALDVSAARMLMEGAAGRGKDPAPKFKDVGKVGEAVRACRMKGNLSQRELGDLAGLDRNHISRVETKANNLALDTLEKIVAALGVPIDQLMP